MADVALNLLSVSGLVGSHRQAILPDAQSGTFVGDDTDNHDCKFAGRGKGKITVAVDNPCNQTVTATIYGMHSATGAVGDVGTFSIGSFTVTAAGDKGYEVVGDAFPFYLVRLAFSVTPTDDPLVSVTVYVDSVS